MENLPALRIVPKKETLQKGKGALVESLPPPMKVLKKGTFQEGRVVLEEDHQTKVPKATTPLEEITLMGGKLLLPWRVLKGKRAPEGNLRPQMRVLKKETPQGEKEALLESLPAQKRIQKKGILQDGEEASPPGT